MLSRPVMEILRQHICRSHASRLGLLLLVSWLLLSPGQAQVPGIPGLNKPDPKAPENGAAQDPAKRLDDWQKQAGDTLSRLEGKAPPEGVEMTEFEARLRTAEQTLQVIVVTRKQGEVLADATKATAAAKDRAAAWKGFDAEPPYSILMLDELEDERVGREAKLTLLESSQATLEHLLNSTLEDVQKAEALVSREIQNVQNSNAAQNEAAKWRLESTREFARLQAVRALSLRARHDTIKEQVAASKVELGRVDRMLAVARPEARFLDADVEHLKKVSAEQEASLRKEADALDRRINTVVNSRKPLQVELERLMKSEPDSPETGLARLRVATADVRLEAIRGMREKIDGLVQLEKAARLLQQHRHDLWVGVEEPNRSKIIADMTLYSARFRDWSNLFKIEQETVVAELSNIDTRKQSLAQEDPRLALFEQQRTARVEELEMLRRANQTIVNQRQLLQRWLQHFAPEEHQEGSGASWRKAMGRVRQLIFVVWSFELMSFENQVEVDGEIITGKVPLTVSILTKAVLFLWIGYWVAARGVRRIRHAFVDRGHIEAAQAKTLANWIMLLVLLALLAGALELLSIPLTVFAFLGGALAIGLGFGTQTLIKNFISGIILLFERKIRVGDIINVDGVVGKVTEVNTRSSIIRGPDDVETMIPNSFFLEQQVTNWTLSNPQQRRSVRVGVAYGSDTRLVMDLLKGAAEKHGLVCKSPAPFVVFEDFGDSALIFILYFWYDLRGDGNPMVVASDLRMMMEKHLREAGIVVPFPQRDMHLNTSEPIRVAITRAEKE